MSDEQHFKCACGSCNGHITFPASYAGETITCPHCSQPTMLPTLEQLLPPPAPTEEPAPAPPPPAPASAPKPQARPVARPQAKPQQPPAAVAQPKPKGYVVKPGQKKPGDQRPESKLADPYAAELERREKQVRCPECGAKVEGADKVCPHCGAVISKSMKRIRRYGSLAILGLGAFLLVTWPYQWPAFLAKRAIRTTPPRYQAEVLHFAVEKDKNTGLMWVNGVATNHAPVQLFGVKIEFPLVDKAGNTLNATAVTQLPIFEPHKTWAFKALLIDPDAVGAKTNTITWTR